MIEVEPTKQVDEPENDEAETPAPAEESAKE
jgi:hypothetical protein